MIIKQNSDEIQNYLSDASNYSGSCEAVYFPENENDVAALLKKSSDEKKRITISGNGTGLTGARVPEGGIVLSVEKMNRIIEVNESEKYAIVEPGVLLKDFQDEVESRNLFYPPDPTERNCFIGATVATNSSGARTFKYGPTRDYVLSLRIVLSDGEIIKISRDQFRSDGYDAMLLTESGKILSFNLPKYEMPETKNAAGYYCKENMDLIDIFIGSEGTLGVITQIKLKLIELPMSVFSSVAFFRSEDDALNFIEHARSISRENRLIANKKLSARGLEFFDKNGIDFLRDAYTKIPDSAEAAVWFEQETGNEKDSPESQWIEILDRYNCITDESWLALGSSDEETFKEFRHAIAWKVNEYITQKGLKKVGTDTAVPEQYFKEFYRLSKKMVEENGLKYVIYGHAGNCHLHLNMLPENPFQFQIAKKVYSDLCALAVSFKGTVSAEHGIGKAKREYLIKMYGEDVVRKMALLKLAFDPIKILSIGNIFEERFLD
ncbi:MAG TPA: FAD-binding oxidoreductase [Melioribacteraceae bacterium]|nr:FAD-binding oxidoreductase [Melioribacteraceae bacterium]